MAIDLIRDYLDSEFKGLVSKKVKSSKILWNMKVEYFITYVKATVVRSKVYSSKKFITITKKSRNIKNDLYSVRPSSYKSFRANNINLYDYSYDIKHPKKVISYKI